MRRGFLFLMLPPLFALPATAFAAAKIRTVPITIVAGEETRTIDFTDANPVGGISLAVGDLGADGIPELIVANGVALEPRVAVLRQDGTEIGGFLAYDKKMD